jgi:hypothetical protein
MLRGGGGSTVKLQSGLDFWLFDVDTCAAWESPEGLITGLQHFTRSSYKAFSQQGGIGRSFATCGRADLVLFDRVADYDRLTVF